LQRNPRDALTEFLSEGLKGNGYDSQRLEPCEGNSMAKPQPSRSDLRQDAKSTKKRFVFLGALRALREELFLF